MYIISKFKDYYDSAVGMGIDKSIVYNRNMVEYTVSGYNNTKIIDPKLCNSFPFFNDYTRYEIKNNTYFDISIGIILFCGKSYPYFKIERSLNCKTTCSDEYFKLFGTNDSLYIYDIDTFLKYIDIYDYKFKGFSYTSPVQRLKENFKMASEYDPSDLHFKYKSPIILLYNEKYYTRKMCMTVNPKLKSLRFASQIHPYTAFQEIQMYISGVISNTEFPGETEMSELDKVNQHGFDKKYSFRTRPKS